jgi:hypothetical protein
MNKRAANSPAEAEKTKKHDEKTTPLSPPQSGIMSFFRSKPQTGTAVEENEQHQQQTQEDGWQTQRRSPPPRRSPPRTYSEAASSAIENQASSMNFTNLAKKNPGPNPDFRHPHTKPVFSSRNEGAFRDFFDIEIRTINGQPFRGTITYVEAKHAIYKGILEMDFNNFRGVRLGFKGVPTATILLKEQINLDDLEHIQDFEFERIYKKMDKKTKQYNEVRDVLGCKIKGVRTVYGGEASVPYSEDWTRVVKIEGCDYMVESKTLIDFLGNYGEVTSDLVEDVFEDEENSEGDNATGIYSVKMKLNKAIPQLVPIGGKRLKIYYRNIQKLCSKCFGEHYARNCTNQKVPWIKYVEKFIATNNDLNVELFGNWNQIVERLRLQERAEEHRDCQAEGADKNQREVIGETKSGNNQEPEVAQQEEEVATNQNQESEIQTEQVEPAPQPADFSLPDTEEGMDDLIEKLTLLGMTYSDAQANVEKRKKAYQQALRKHQQQGRVRNRAKTAKSRKNSLNG